MGYRESKKVGGSTQVARASGGGLVPGRRTLTQQLSSRADPAQARRAPGGTVAVEPSYSGSTGAGPGTALPGEVKAKMEGAFDADFSSVRIHQDGRAAAMGALAFAQGNDLHFQPGQYDPHGHAGQELLGHELAHVVQQAQGRVSSPQGKGAPIVEDHALEREADEMGARAARGEATGLATSLADGGAGASSRAGAPIQGKVIEAVNLHRVAERVHHAIAGWGTDEEGVYAALASLHHDSGQINELRRIYRARYGETLDAAIDGDFSGAEQSHAMSLLKAHPAPPAPAPAGGPPAPAPAGGPPAPAGGAAPAPPPPDYDKLASRIHAAVDGAGTDEEAVYAALSTLDSDPDKILRLDAAYQARYGQTLRADLRDDFSGDELRHVLELLGDRSNSERIDVANDAEAQQARQIIQDIQEHYGIDVNSQASVDAIVKDYPEAPASVRRGVKTEVWQLKELVALQHALQHFAPILGKRRKASTRADKAQEIRSVGKVAQGIDEDSAQGALDNTTMGEYFERPKNFTMFTAGTDNDGDFPGNNAMQLEGTAIHEIAHGLMKYALADFVQQIDYWGSTYLASGVAGAEAPITAYGGTNASEDLAEAVMYYFVDPNGLQNGTGGAPGTFGNPCPKRFAFIASAVQHWQAPAGTP